MDLIKFYLGRDGEENARKSILMQFEVSVRALLNAQSHATSREYRTRFVDDAQKLAEFLGHSASLKVMVDSLQGVSEKIGRMAEKDAAKATPFLTQFQAALDAVLAANTDASTVFDRIRNHPLDTPKPSVVYKQVTVSAADLDRVMQLLKAENLSYTLS
jgi:hypothetical protein